MGRKQREKILQFIDDLVAQATRVMTTSLGIQEESAKRAATDIAHAMCCQYGKSYMYVPTDLDFQLSDRDHELYRKYGEDGPVDGRGIFARRYTRDRVDQLAAEYGLTSQQVYNIIRLMKRLELKERQGVLPGLEEA